MTLEQFQKLIDEITPHVHITKVDDNLYVVDGRDLERHLPSGHVRHGKCNVCDLPGLPGGPVTAAEALINNSRQQARDRTRKRRSP